MSSLVRGAGFAQRNNNVTKLTPVYETTFDNTNILPDIDISNCPIYSLNLPDVQHVAGIYYVDMNGVDSNNNLIDLNGIFGNETIPITMVAFSVNIPTPASIYPGQEFTLFFKNLPIENLPYAPLMTIAIIVPFIGPIPYIFSPPFPATIGNYQNLSVSLTFKSDGSNFNIVSSGPSGWLGLANIAGLLELYTNILP